MAAMWRKAMLYLGLGPDDEYDDYEPIDEPIGVPSRSPAPVASRYPAAPAPVRELERDGPRSDSRSISRVGGAAAGYRLVVTGACCARIGGAAGCSSTTS